METALRIVIVLRILSFYRVLGEEQEETLLCSSGEIRLTVAANITTSTCNVTDQPTELQICLDGRWCSVCSKGWNGMLSRTTCRWLEYSTGYRLPVGGDSNQELVAAAQIDCTGQEELSQCTSLRNGSCPLQNIVHLNCSGESVDETSTRQECSEGDLRLAGSETMNVGNLEVCQFGVWGSICNTEWSEANSDIACGVLGFTAGTDTENKASMRLIDECISPIHLYNVTCSGEEDNFLNCLHTATSVGYTINANCGIHLECSITRAVCEDGEVDLHLLDPNVPEQGWLLICFNEEWRTLCDSQWDFLDSTVACRELGFIGGFHFELPLASTTKDIYAIHADNVRCLGNETRLLECGHSTEHSCIHTRDVFLICRGSGDGCDNGDVRLVDGTSDKEGRLEFCWNDIWGTVCNFDWVRRNTGVTCQQLGLYSGYEENGQLQPTKLVPALIEKADCSGSEQRLADCAFQFAPAYSCALHANDVILTCAGEEDLSDCEDGELSVVGGRNSGEGLLKICHQKMWGTICGNNWDVDTDSVVACRQLGFNRSVTPRSTVDGGKGPIHFTDFMCNGTEESITECPFQPVELYTSTCDHSRDIHLACRDPIQKSSANTIIVAYALIPVVLLLAGSVVIVSVVLFYLKRRSKHQGQQPKKNSLLLQQTRSEVGHQVYRNAVCNEDMSTRNSVATYMFPEGHYMVSESVMGHIYESIDHDDIVRVCYNGEYHQYSLTEREEEEPPGTKSIVPATYDKLDKNRRELLGAESFVPATYDKLDDSGREPPGTKPIVAAASSKLDKNQRELPCTKTVVLTTCDKVEPLGTNFNDSATYNELGESGEISVYNVLNRSDKNAQDGSNLCERLELRVTQENRGYNKLQRNRHKVKHETESRAEDYEKIDFPEDVENN